MELKWQRGYRMLSSQWQVAELPAFPCPVSSITSFVPLHGAQGAALTEEAFQMFLEQTRMT